MSKTAEDIQKEIEEAKKHAENMVANARDDVEHADAVAHLEKQIAKLSILKKRRKYK